MTWKELAAKITSLPEAVQNAQAVVWPPEGCPAAQVVMITDLGVNAIAEPVMLTGKMPPGIPTTPTVVIVNGRSLHTAEPTLSYEQVLVMAGYLPGRVISVMWGVKGNDDSGGILTRGGVVTVKPGLHITAMETGNA